MSYKNIFILICTFSYNNSITTHTAIDPSKERVIICGVGKNIAPFLPNMIQKIERLAYCFKDYRIIIYENNSTDKTKKLLKKWSKTNSNVLIISENLSKKQLHNRTIYHAISDQAPCRMELISYARNQVLTKAMDHEFHNFKFIIMTDLDFYKGWDVPGVLSSFACPLEWHGITANCIDGNANYYDRYAYRDEQFPLGPEILGEDFWRNLENSRFKISINDNFRKVYSAFGGIGIYKRVALRNCKYFGHITPDLKDLLQHIFALDNAYLPPIKFQKNSGYDGPVVCEHVTFHASMIQKGYDRLYINPQMRCFY